MASAALDRFNQAVDLLSINTARKADVKAAGEQLYVAGARETIAHLRKHLIAVRDDAGETTGRRQRAAAVVTLIEEMATRYSDAWWTDIADLV